MDADPGALFSTRETVPGASPTLSATVFRVTVPGLFKPFFWLPVMLFRIILSPSLLAIPVLAIKPLGERWHLRQSGGIVAGSETIRNSDSEGQGESRTPRGHQGPHGQLFQRKAAPP